MFLSFFPLGWIFHLIPELLISCPQVPSSTGFMEMLSFGMLTRKKSTLIEQCCSSDLTGINLCCSELTEHEVERLKTWTNVLGRCANYWIITSSGCPTLSLTRCIECKDKQFSNDKIISMHIDSSGHSVLTVTIKTHLLKAVLNRWNTDCTMFFFLGNPSTMQTFKSKQYWKFVTGPVWGTAPFTHRQSDVAQT